MDTSQQQYQQQYYNPHQSQYIQHIPQGYQPQPYHQAPRIVPFSRPWHIAKIVFRSLDLVFSIIVIGISAWLVTLPYDISSILFLICSGPPAILAIIWEVAEFITICARGGKLGIHPGAHVGLHLLIWLGCATAIGFEVTIRIFQECDYYCRLQGGSAYFPAAVASQDATLAFTILLLITHFILFVRACVETHQRNRQAPPILMVSNNMPMYLTNQQPVMGQQYPQTVYPQEAHLSTNISTPSTHLPTHEPKEQINLQNSTGVYHTEHHSGSVAADGTFYGKVNDQHHPRQSP